MPRYRHEPDDDDDFDEDDLPDGVYHDDDSDELPTILCPYCQESILEEAQYCPRCENYVSKEDAPRDRKPTWIWVLLILALVASLLSLVM